jgi:hypothetical protein
MMSLSGCSQRPLFGSPSCLPVKEAVFSVNSSSLAIQARDRSIILLVVRIEYERALLGDHCLVSGTVEVVRFIQGVAFDRHHGLQHTTDGRKPPSVSG